MDAIFWGAFSILFGVIGVGIYILGRMCWELYKTDMDFQIPTDEEDFH